MSPLPSRRPKRKQKCYVTPPFSGIPNAKRGERKNQKWSPTNGNKIISGCLTPAFSEAQKRAEMRRHRCILGDPQRQARGTKNQKWSPTKGNKIRSGYLTRAFLGAQKRAEMPCHPFILGDPQQRGTKSEVAASPLILIFFGSRSCIKVSVGRVTKKVYLAFVYQKKSETRLFFFAAGRV